MKKVIPATAAALTSLLAVTGYTVFKEVMTNEKKIGNAVSAFFMKRQAKKAEENPTEAREQGRAEKNIQWYNAQNLINCKLKNDDGNMLNANLILNAEPTDKFILCSHGYTSSGYGEFGKIAKFWYEQGFNVFLVDHQAHGDSEGKLIGFGLRECRDCIKWIEYLKKEYGADIKVGLHGISMGAATVMMMSGDDNLPENVKFAVEDCGYTDLRLLFKHALNDLIHLPAFPILNITELYNMAINGYKFSDVIPLERVENAKIPMLFIHGADDFLVPVTMCGELYSGCPSKIKDMLIVDGAGHADSYGADYRLYEAKTAEFVKRVFEV